MGLLGSKKHDPLSDRARSLNLEIAALEAQIRELGAQVENNHQTSAAAGEDSGGNGSPVAPGADLEPVFEQVDPSWIAVDDRPESTRQHYNELGVRKYDLAAAWRRLRQHFSGPPANNPRLINYLAAGSIQGLRPLRYEKRVARNRVLALSLLLLFVLWGLIAVLGL